LIDYFPSIHDIWSLSRADSLHAIERPRIAGRKMHDQKKQITNQSLSDSLRPTCRVFFILFLLLDLAETGKGS
jgi:hypothetical protein